MPLVVNKGRLKINGKIYKKDDPVLYTQVGRILPALRSAGIVRSVDMTEREAYTSGERFKKYFPPFVESIVNGLSDIQANLTLNISPEVNVDAASDILSVFYLVVALESAVSCKVDLNGDLSLELAVENDFAG